MDARCLQYILHSTLINWHHAIGLIKSCTKNVPESSRTHLWCLQVFSRQNFPWLWHFWTFSFGKCHCSRFPATNTICPPRKTPSVALKQSSFYSWSWWFFEQFWRCLSKVAAEAGVLDLKASGPWWMPIDFFPHTWLFQFSLQHKPWVFAFLAAGPCCELFKFSVGAYLSSDIQHKGGLCPAGGGCPRLSTLHQTTIQAVIVSQSVNTFAC